MAGIHQEACAQSAGDAGDSVASNSLYQKDFISLKEISLNQIEQVLNVAEKIKSGRLKPDLKNKIIASCFFEPSTRTRLSFESAVLRSGGNSIGFSSSDGLSTKKGESLQDTVRVISAYADLLVIRHPNEGAARLAADIATVPVVNAGDGANQHPTQTMIDLFSIKECQGQLNDLSIALVGDLKYGRTVHSLAQACQLFNIRLYLVSPESLALPEYICDYLKRKSVRFSFHKSLKEIIHKVDILYMTRVQKERMPGIDHTDAMKHLTLTKSLLGQAKATMKVLHPLPRVNEIEEGVDATPFAYYFQQSANGVCLRQALLSLILNPEIS